MVRSGRVWVGLGVTAAFLVVLFWQVDIREVGAALAAANYAYVVPAVAVYFVALLFRAYRWRRLLWPVLRVPTSRLYPVVVVGYMANNLLPMRLGEVVRSYYLSRREPVGASTALATVVVERVFDGLTLLFFLVVAALFMPVAGLVERVDDATPVPFFLVVPVVVLPFLAALGLIVSVALFPRAFERRVAWVVRRLPPGPGAAVRALLERFMGGFRDMHRPGRLVQLFLLSLPVWLAEGAMYYVVALGFDLDGALGSTGLLVGAMLIVTALANLATSIPSSQGSVGPFELFAAMGLVALGVEGALASAYALLLHAVLLLPVIGVGLLHLAVNSVSLGQLTGHAAEAGPAPAERTG